MGTITAGAIITKSALLLYDVNNIKWSRAELLGWLNDAQRHISLTDPTANNVTVAVKLVAGTRQSIPADGWTLMDVYRNMGTTGTTPGRAIRIVSRKALDTFNPNWHSAAQVTAVREYAYDPDDQLRFWVSPPSDGTGYAEVNYCQVPADIITEPTVILINDTFEPMLIDYLLFRANSKDSEFAKIELAEKHWAAFTGAMAIRSGTKSQFDPNTTLAPPMPASAPGAP